MSAMETTVWTGRGFNPTQGTLGLCNQRLRFEAGGVVAFDASIPELRLSWPWYGFGCQFWAHVGQRKYFISFLHARNTWFSWWQGVQKGRRWRKAIQESGR